jgi:hypothetical protein
VLLVVVLRGYSCAEGELLHCGHPIAGSSGAQEMPRFIISGGDPWQYPWLSGYAKSFIIFLFDPFWSWFNTKQMW